MRKNSQSEENAPIRGEHEGHTFRKDVGKNANLLLQDQMTRKMKFLMNQMVKKLTVDLKNVIIILINNLKRSDIKKDIRMLINNLKRIQRIPIETFLS